MKIINPDTSVDIYTEDIPADRYDYNYIFGTISDALGPIAATIQMFYISSNNPATDPTAIDGEWDAWTRQPDQLYVKFTAKGYKTVKIKYTDLMQHTDVVMQKGSNIEPWMIAVVLAAVVAYKKMQKKKGKKIGALTTGDVFPIFLLAGGVIAFSVLKQILESIGLWTSQDTKDLDQQAASPSNFWNPSYWQTIKPANANWSYAITQSTADQYSQEIYDSFTWYNDCEECVKAVFKRLRTKANASFVAWQFNNRYGYDLLDFLRGGWWPQDRLSDSDVNEINQYLSRLPNY